MSDSEESVFNFDIDEEDISPPHPKKMKNIGERACAWTFQDRWHCSYTTVGAARIEDRRMGRDYPFPSGASELLISNNKCNST